MINIPLPVYRPVPGGSDQHVPRAEEDRDTEPGGEETDRGTTKHSHENMFALSAADGNSAAARLPFVTRLAAFVTDREPPSPMMLKT